MTRNNKKSEEKRNKKSAEMESHLTENVHVRLFYSQHSPHNSSSVVRLCCIHAYLMQFWTRTMPANERVQVRQNKKWPKSCCIRNDETNKNFFRILNSVALFETKNFNFFRFFFLVLNKSTKRIIQTTAAAALFGLGSNDKHILQRSCFYFFLIFSRASSLSANEFVSIRSMKNCQNWSKLIQWLS